ncbi:MAG: T9SS type A sorting domain-containing protein [Bacteroidales bacterium]|nr:T9SS type A sorting domain-containing protein [Bacteroidales bacterium]MBK9356322.1 T9SS type A sorting domain-containing protein [Bacteroidales bacterium]
MKKIYLSVLASLAFLMVMASPDIYTPELVAPDNSATDAAPNVELDWNAVAGQIGLHYEVQLSLDEAFTNPVTFSTELTAYRMTNLLFGQLYFWRVRAIDSEGTSAWSSSRSFTTIVKPVIRRPNPNSSGAAPNVQIIWFEITGVSFFDFQLDTVSTFDSPEAHITSVAGSLVQTNAAALYFGKDYYLRVRARHSADTSEWSESRKFTVVNVFALKKPDNATAGLAPDVQLEWNTIAGLDKYNIHIATDNEFNHSETYIAAKNLTKLVPDTLHFGTQYFWKMEAIHTRDTLFSEVRNFTTVDKVTLNSPANNATNVELVPFLKWEKISGVLQYKLEFASNPQMTSSSTYSITATTTAGPEQYKLPNNLLDSANTYYWRVRAISSSDTSNWSDTWNFRSVALGVDEPVFSNGMRIYPTPASDQVNIQFKSRFTGGAVVSLFDLLGKTRIAREVQVVNGVIRDFQLGTLSNGIYMLRIESQGVSSTSKLIIRR